MKKQIKSAWLLLLLLIPFSLKAFQNTSVKEQSITTLIFVPQMVYPLGMAARQATAGFELRIGKDTINSYLPYFGRAYTADYGTTEGGTQFTSSNFDYNENITKKARNIVIKLKDNKDAREIRITIYGDGYAYVQLNFNQRQSIGYRGQISEQDE